MKRGLVLFAHGARDAKWVEPFEYLQKLTQAQLPDVVVSLAFLELMSPRLPELVPELIAKGCTEVTVVPVFLGKGGHVARDLPLLLGQLQSHYPEVVFKTTAAVGEDVAVLQAMAEYCVGALTSSNP